MSSVSNNEISAEIERRVGRNLLLYQRVENGLKELLLRSYVEGPSDGSAQRLATRAAKIMRLNMGEAAKAVFEQVLTDVPTPLSDPSSRSEAAIRSRFTIGSHPDYPDAIAALRTRCKEVVDARNDLVHHFLRQTSRESADHLRAAMEALDAQHTAALVVREEIVAHLQSLAESQYRTAEYFASEAGQQALELAMAEGNVVEVLADVTQSEARPDGWTLLTTALHRARAAVPADVERLRQQFGQRWIRQVLERCSALFELADEPMPNGPAGSKRAIYRPRG